MKSFVILFTLLVMVCQRSEAVAYFQGRSEMIQNADVIVIIELQEPVEAKADPAAGNVDPFTNAAQGKAWSYRKQATAKVIRWIKGEVPKGFNLYGDEGFICAQCNLAKGKYLAFLKKDGVYWAGSNWQLSLRPIRGDEVEWYVKGEERGAMQYQNLEGVVSEVRDVMGSCAGGGPDGVE